jgi:hypothetical protein
MWDKYIPKHWENLTCKRITDWVNNKSGNPTAQQHSPEQWAAWILCSPDGFNAILDSKAGTHPECDHYTIVDADYMADDGSSVNDGTLAKRWIEHVCILFWQGFEKQESPF